MGEDLITRLMPAKEIPELITAGRIGHGLVIVALSYYEHWRRNVGSLLPNLP